MKNPSRSCHSAKRSIPSSRRRAYRAPAIVVPFWRGHRGGYRRDGRRCIPDPVDLIAYFSCRRPEGVPCGSVHSADHRGDPMSLIDLYRGSVESFVDRVSQIRLDQWGAPTPCAEWDVRTLVNHIVYEQKW